MVSITPLVTLVTGEALQPTLILPGQVCEMAMDVAQQLVERELAVYAEKTSSSATQLASDEQMNAVIDAIAEIPKSSYGKDGKPSVKSIQSIVEFDVTASQRDEAWQHFQQLSQS